MGNTSIEPQPLCLSLSQPFLGQTGLGPPNSFLWLHLASDLSSPQTMVYFKTKLKTPLLNGYNFNLWFVDFDLAGGQGVGSWDTVRVNCFGKETRGFVGTISLQLTLGKTLVHVWKNRKKNTMKGSFIVEQRVKLVSYQKQEIIRCFIDSWSPEKITHHPNSMIPSLFLHQHLEGRAHQTVLPEPPARLPSWFGALHLGGSDVWSMSEWQSATAVGAGQRTTSPGACILSELECPKPS